MTKSKKKNIKGTVFGDWELVQFISQGGNGEVWGVKNKSSSKNVIKILKSLTNNKKKKRFIKEINFLKKNSDISGVLPIVDNSIPKKNKNIVPWYVMPIAIPLKVYLKDKSYKDILIVFLKLAKTLSILHKKNFVHRDIKPDNLFFYDNHPCFGDFGLVKENNKTADLTGVFETVGPRWTIAPEMKRKYSNKADGKKADSYSFAKTLWIILTNVTTCFDGQYIINSDISLSNYLEETYTKPLDDLLYRCTQTNPNKRLNLEQIVKELNLYIELIGDYTKRNIKEWADVQELLFSTTKPHRVIWTSNKDIVFILNNLSKSDSLNHMFFPDGGGMDLSKAQISSEIECIELNALGSTYIIKPKQLIYESFKNCPELNYFRLETSPLQKVGSKDDCTSDREVLTELESGLYTSYKSYDQNNFKGNPVRPKARKIERFFIECCFVIFSKTSKYNQIQSTYDGRHNKMDSIQFRDHVQQIANPMCSNNTKKEEPKTSIIYKKYIQPVLKGRRLSKEEIILLKKTIEMNKSFDKKKEKYEIKFGLSKVSNSFEQYKLYSSKEFRDIEEELENFIDTLSEKEIILIAAVFVSGSEYFIDKYCIPIEDSIKDVKNRGDLKDFILGNNNTVLYLENGIKAYT